ncbi:kynureninase, partial [Bacillus pseudomycoides]
MYQDPFEPSYEYAIKCDKRDELAEFQKEFYKKADTIYLDGNSLGLL